MKKISQPKVSIVILNWNGKKNTFELIDSLREMVYSNYEIIVVDNHSQEEIEEDLKKRYAKTITLIKNYDNLGQAEGSNVGIRESLRRNSDYVVVMDNDIRVDKGFLTFLVDAMEKHPEVAIAGPKIYYANPENMIWSAGCDYYPWGFKSRYQNQVDLGQAEKEEYTDALDCVVMMRSRALIKEGLFYSDFFIMHEFTGWCLNASEKGWKCLFVPKSKVWHKVSASMNKVTSRLSLYYDIRNWVICIKRNKSKFYFLGVVFLEITALFLIRMLRYTKRGEFSLIKPYILAMWHALTNQMPAKMYLN